MRAIRAGNYPEVAAAHAGIHPATYYRWMERGELAGNAAEDEPFRRFRSEVERALADAEAAAVGLIGKAARDGDSRAATWLLERRFSERWGRTRAPAEPTRPTRRCAAQTSETARSSACSRRRWRDALSPGVRARAEAESRSSKRGSGGDVWSPRRVYATGASTPDPREAGVLSASASQLSEFQSHRSPKPVTRADAATRASVAGG